MTNGADGTAGAHIILSETGAARAALVQATRASGVLVRVKPDAFLEITGNARGALVVVSITGIWQHEYHYLTSYKGLAFYTKSKRELDLPGDVELVNAKQIWIPQ